MQAGMPLPTMARPINASRAPRAIMLQSTQPLTITKSAGAHGYPGTRNGRGASGWRMRKTNTAPTVKAENKTMANIVNVRS